MASGTVPSAAQKLAAACGAEAIAQASVQASARRAIDGRTLTLDDGREVRLAGIEVAPLPPAQQTGERIGVASNGTAAKDALDALAGGDEVVLRRAEETPDRYGRIVAYVYAERDDDELFVQGELLASGFARVGDRVGSRACATELLDREAVARKAALGVWADPAYRVLDAAKPAEVLAQRGDFAVVEGTVISAHESGATLYLNFGERWSEDFSATVRKRDEKNFAAAGIDLKSLAGRRVRVRGFVEARGAAGESPSMAVDRPEQIETIGPP